MLPGSATTQSLADSQSAAFEAQILNSSTESHSLYWRQALSQSLLIQPNGSNVSALMSGDLRPDRCIDLLVNRIPGLTLVPDLLRRAESAAKAACDL